MPKVSKEHLAARKQQILTAAAHCFAKKGFHQSTMQDICAEAGLSPGALYRYFKGKEEIIIAIATESWGRNLGFIDTVYERSGSLRETVNELARYFFSGIEDFDNAIAKLDIELWAEAMRNEEVARLVKEVLDNFINSFVRLLSTAQQRGELSQTTDVVSFARILVSLYRGMLIQKSIDRNADVWAYRDTAFRMIDLLLSAESVNA